jgi:drug/metabolite transporter (DMT)-like permease
VKFPWYVSAIGAALVWGIHYPLLDHALKRLSLFTVLFLTVLPMLLAAPFYYPQLAVDAGSIARMSWAERLPVLLIPLTSLAGAVLLFLAIGGKNATLASIIEISYPVFVVFFAWLLFRQVHLNASVLVGAALVFAGVALIILNNPR